MARFEQVTGQERADHPSAEPGTATSAASLLRVQGVEAGYGKRPVLHGVDLTVAEGEIVAVIGHNGAGKTTLLRTVLGLVRATAGTVTVLEHDVTAIRARGHRTAGPEVAMVPSERFVFGDLTVRDNLRLAARGLDATRRDRRMAELDDLFPILGERSGHLAGQLSGGQQRMVSLAMALLSEPRLLLLDEPSLGLAPKLAQDVLRTVARVAEREQLGVVLLEQNVPAALSIAHRILVLRSGRIIEEMTPSELQARGPERWWELF